MLAIRCSGKSFAWAIISLMIQMSSSAFAYVESHLPANRSISLQLCDPAASGYPYPHYFHYNVFGNGTPSPGYTWSVDGYTAPVGYPQNGVTADLPAGTACKTVTVVTSGIPANVTTDIIDFGSCYRYPPPAGPTCTTTVGWYTFVTPVTPSMTISPPGPINFINQTPRITAETVTLNPNIATLTVSASCTTQYGAVATVAPLTPGSNLTDDLGHASFNITTSVTSPVPGQTPSGTCTFSVPGGTNASSIAINGTLFDPTVGVAPSSIVNPGTRTVVATITPAYPGVQLDGTCASTIAVVSITPAATTNSQGQATFTVSAQNLIAPNPNLSIVPSAACKIQVHGGTYFDNIHFTTGNSCAFGLQPDPAQCGNPT